MNSSPCISIVFERGWRDWAEVQGYASSGFKGIAVKVGKSIGSIPNQSLNNEDPDVNI